jgi:hypothetical protein
VATELYTSKVKLPLNLRKQRILIALLQTFFWLPRIVIGKVNESPPAWFKRRQLLILIKKFKVKHFIETGTYLGQTTELVARNFPEILIDTIEVDRELYLRARSCLSNYSPQVRIWYGDSSSVLSQVLKERVVGRVLFWLDGHLSQGITSSGSEETPLSFELEIISNHLISASNDCLIVIDDFHEILSNPNYPALDLLIDFTNRNSLNIEIKWNMVFISRTESC